MTHSLGRCARRAWVAAVLSLCVIGTAERGAGDSKVPPRREDRGRVLRSMPLGGSFALAVVLEDFHAAATTTPVDQTEGMIPRRLVWPGVVVIVVIAVIVTAALTGPMIRANTDDEEESSPPNSSD